MIPCAHSRAQAGRDQFRRRIVLKSWRPWACVDHVTIFDTPRVTDVIRTVRPQVYVKGGDYTVDSLDPEERAALLEAGTRIQILPLEPGKSTTATIERWKR